MEFNRLTLEGQGRLELDGSLEILFDPVSGADRKCWVSYKGEKYLMKLDPVKAETEHVGSVFFNQLGVRAHDTILALYQGQPCCLAKDIIGGATLRTFKCMHDSSVWPVHGKAGDQAYTFSDVLDTLDHYAKGDAGFVEQLSEQFVRMFVVDAILANRDRHGGNWGYLVNGSRRELCPVFDNAACLFPDFEPRSPLSKQQWYRLVVDSPRSQVQVIPGKKNTFYRIFQECRNSIDLAWINLEDVKSAASVAVSDLSSERAEFYKTLVALRYLCIVEGVDFREAFDLYGSQ